MNISITQKLNDLHSFNHHPYPLMWWLRSFRWGRWPRNSILKWRSKLHPFGWLATSKISITQKVSDLRSWNLVWLNWKLQPCFQIELWAIVLCKYNYNNDINTWHKSFVGAIYLFVKWYRCFKSQAPFKAVKVKF